MSLHEMTGPSPILWPPEQRRLLARIIRTGRVCLSGFTTLPRIAVQLADEGLIVIERKGRQRLLTVNPDALARAQAINARFDEQRRLTRQRRVDAACAWRERQRDAVESECPSAGVASSQERTECV